jgi:flagellar protein FlbD
MIRLTRINGSEFYLNPQLIELMEEGPETHLTLLNGNRYLVKERVATIVERMVAVQAKITRRSVAVPGRKYLMRPRSGTRRIFAGAGE